jgi:MHS family alpha-ketoglutarate permease-like MFS transporter
MSAHPSATAKLSVASRIKSIFSGSIGNLVEYYDWYAYSAFSLYFSHIFFPGESPAAQLLNTAGIFALGFFMRPIGGWLMGSLADRKGRKSALTLSVTVMCLCSLAIAVTPGYATIGVAAPLTLVASRMIQGLSLGGEYGISATYLSEIATKNHRGFYSSFQYVTLIVGQLIALLVLVVLQRFVLSDQQLMDWGWRIPFAIGGLLSLIALYLRRAMVESEAFAKQARKPENPLIMLREHPRAVLVVIGLTMGGTLGFYTFTTYMQKFLVNTSGFSKGTATEISAAATFLYMLLHPLIGAISDRVGRRPVLIAFGILGTTLTYPILSTLAATRDAWTAFGLVFAGLVIVSFYTAVNAVVKAELFPAKVRATGVGFPYAVAVSLFGGSAEYVAGFFKEKIHHESWFFIYVSGVIFLSLLVYAFTPDTRGTSQIDRD